MIALLERADELAAASPLPGDEAVDLLEWDRVVAQIAACCLGGRAAAAIRSRLPFGSAEAISLHHELADELRRPGEHGQWPPLLDVGEAWTLLERTAPMRLEGADLVHLAHVAEELTRLRTHFLADREAYPRWSEAAVQASSYEALTSAIRRALDPDGRVSDGASPLLGRLRRQLGERERAVRAEVQAAMGKARAAGWTTGDEVTLRGDRFCLPLRSGDSRRVDGIVHDRSASGATLFVEPAAVVRSANELAGLRLETAAEEARIIFALNRSVEQASASLLDSCRLMTLVDTVRAGLVWSRRVRGHRPDLVPGGDLCIRGGRHPLLAEALGAGDLQRGLDRVVPLDVELPADCTTLVISGPNAGGKSVALKTVGVLCMLAQCGWDIPAREDSVLPLTRRLLVDLGDDQSIAESLSSFSAHLKRLAGFLRDAGPDVLVLCDEIGTGTDPQEGTALAFAVLSELSARGALVLASTHFGLLKALVHDHPRMANAAMDYDDEDLRPLFTFRIGDPGTSHAFDIASRMGLPAVVLARAKDLAGEERVQVEKLLVDLDRRSRDLKEARRGVASLERDLEIRESELAERLEGIEKERRTVLDAARRELDAVVGDGRRAIENAVREIRSGSGSAPVVHRARDVLARLEDRLSETGPDDAPPPSVTEGDRVRIPHLGLVGRVVEVRGERLVALAGGLRLTLTRDAVRTLDEEADGTARIPSGGSSAGAGWSWSGEAPSVSPQIDLRGLTGQEGWTQLDQLIDRAIPAGLGSLLVIHGHGTGRLRAHLHACLSTDRRVASFAEAGPGEGGAGATRVLLDDA